ncbi:hypothetical protein [Variovorax sp. PAMC 28711]|uniref:hypothetical protein n=1 Tax=Variovorax sp. PAMC 28711 TaxID=1795631 RepID=UPI00078B7ABC|nr:hypothetical protein [Variovorax sp. PAMC 28711]AMM24890.1 hypothetical protein AX767_11365 [Variovorax sp. PAMC 28711]
MKPFNRLAAVVLVLALAACAAEPTRIAPGTSRADALQQLGQPTAVYPLPGGGERLQYSRAPAGTEVNDVDLDAGGRVVSVRQVLDERWFAQDIQNGVWREADILRTYGRPLEITEVASFDGGVWTWRYKVLNAPRLLYIYVDRQGLVSHWHTGDELTRDRLPF